MLILYITRHGETKWNLEGRLQGKGDSPLTEKGIEGAKSTKEKLNGTKISKIYSSPSKRALDTAKYIGLENVEIEEDSRLMEMDMGGWEGRVWFEIGNEYNMFKENPESYIIPRGESLISVKERIENFFVDFLENNKEGNYLIVTHGATLKIIYMYLNNIPLSFYWDVPLPVNNSLSKIIFEGKKVKEFILGETYENYK